MSAKDAYDILTERLEFPGSARLRAIMEDLMTSEQERNWPKGLLKRWRRKWGCQRTR